MMGSVIIEWQIHADHVYRVYSLLKKEMATLLLEGSSELFIPNAILWDVGRLTFHMDCKRKEKLVQYSQ